MSFKYKPNKFFDKNNSFYNNKYHNKNNMSLNYDENNNNRTLYGQNSSRQLFNPFNRNDYKNRNYPKNNYKRAPIVVKLRGGTKIILSTEREDY